MSREQRQAVDAMLRRRRPSKPQTIEEMRANFAAMMAMMTIPAGVRTTQTTLGHRPSVLVEPEQTAHPGMILYFHGGSFIFGSPETAMSLTANLVCRTGIRAMSLDYRLAPEHPFPAALEDSLVAYCALLDSGVEATSIAFAGDSAGGGIAVSTCLMARTAGLPMPAVVVAFSPGLDKTHSGASMDSKAGIDPFFTRESFDYTDAMYLAGQNPNQELVSPARFADLTGFPPLLLQVGTNEVLLDDSTQMAERARAAGVDVILDVTADVPHVFQAFAGVLEEADQALDRAALFITQHLR
ncbi:alpha/beta hydrolase [Alicyclobacillus suci]|uniref:alpha/beta hydrolase n=1 Tax=Alicyclobacillus suci TaxID=2816080 RepID=UPI001A8CCA88|nr:alpha/beta hydrolase [Alicyclobacillus suci]